MTTAVVPARPHTVRSTIPVAAATALCTAPDPYPTYTRLAADQPVAHDPDSGTWIVAGADAVRAVLTDRAARVRPPDAPVPPGVAGGPAGEVFADLARMTDGEAHARAREPLAPALDAVEQTDPDEPDATAARLARTRLRHSSDGVLTALQHDVPVRTIARLLGVGADETVRAVAEFVRCIPPTAGPEDHAAATTGARHLTEVVGRALEAPRTPLAWALAGGPGPAPVRVANAIGLLNQTLDATAGLVGTTLLALRREGDAVRRYGLGAVVAEVTRHDPPIQNTRRTTTAPVRAGDAEIPAGATVLVLLAAANRDPRVAPDAGDFRPDRTAPVCFTYGAGAHRCPGRDWSVRIAAAVVAQVLDARPDLVRDLPDAPSYRPLGNARIPVLDRVGAP